MLLIKRLSLVTTHPLTFGGDHLNDLAPASSTIIAWKLCTTMKAEDV